MSKQIGTIVFLFFLLTNVSAQEKWNYPETEKKSYLLYSQQKWEELIDYTHEARKNGIDFFYLQARTGIAYYNLKKYNQAIPYFWKAWESDHSQEWLQEYLYYSLVFAGRSVEASKISDKFTASLKQKTGFQKSKPIRAAFEGGYSFNPDFDKLLENAFDEELNINNDYGEAFFLKDYHFESLDFSHQVSPGFLINHNFTYLNISRKQQVDWGGRNYFPIKTNQFQYFLNPVFVVGKKLNLSPSFNIISGNSSYFSGGYTDPVFIEKQYKFTDYIFSVSGWSHFGNFAPGLEINAANIYDLNFTQFSAWLTYYPFSNLNFYITPRIYFKNEKQSSNSGYNAFGISGGLKLGNMHLSGQYLNGDMKNFIEPAGYVVSNFPGRSTQKITGSLYFPLSKRYQFVIRYINQDIIEQYKVYSNGIFSNSMEYKYFKHTLTAGISWNFY